MYFPRCSHIAPSSRFDTNPLDFLVSILGPASLLPLICLFRALRPDFTTNMGRPSKPPQGVKGKPKRGLKHTRS